VVPVKYLGHQTIGGVFGDYFQLLDSILCPKCNYQIDGFICNCEDYMLELPLKIEIPVPTEG
jgi:hypothetical protein